VSQGLGQTGFLVEPHVFKQLIAAEPAGRDAGAGQSCRANAAFCPAPLDHLLRGPALASDLFMTDAQKAMLCDFKAVSNLLAGAARQEAQAGLQNLPGAAVIPGARPCR